MIFGKFSDNVSLNIDNETKTEDLTITNQFNNLFTSFAKNPVTKIQKTFLKNKQHSFFMSPTTKKDVEDILGTPKTHKLIGPGSIPTRILKEFKKYFSKPISDLINLSFLLGIFPQGYTYI